MIEMVSLAESRLRQGRPVVFAARPLAAAVAGAAEIAPIIRGAAAIKQDGVEPTRFIAEFRTAPEILDYVNGAELDAYSQRGVVTPDHIIRTSNTRNRVEDRKNIHPRVLRGGAAWCAERAGRGGRLLCHWPAGRGREGRATGECLADG